MTVNMTVSTCAMCRTGHHCCNSCQGEHWPHGHNCAQSVVTDRGLAMVPVKPTCAIQPGSHMSPTSDGECHDEEEEKVCLPGFTGLFNLGNTCFLNSVIQSLSNTRELRDYFHDQVFKEEINYNNPLGTGGRLAGVFSTLLRDLWKGTDHAFSPSKLKAIVVSKSSQFAGHAQHDAQEFMAFLLDGLHEDLNRIQNKPYTETVDSDGRPDEVVAEEAWQRHKMRNDSFIMDLFQGQFKSKLVCPTCSKVSITFDPFLYLPVPLPQKQKILTIYYFAKEPHKKPIKFLVSVSMENSSIAEVLGYISRSVRIKPENLRLAEVVKGRFQQIFRPSHSLKSLLSEAKSMLFCIEVLSKELAKERVVLLRVEQRLQVSCKFNSCKNCLTIPLSKEDKLKRCFLCFSVAYCNRECQLKHWPSHKKQCQPVSVNVGLPFLVSVPESQLTYVRLTQLLKDYSMSSVNVSQLPFQSCSSQGSLAEKEMSCEKAVWPEAAVTGHQQPSEAVSNHAIQFYISLNSNSKDQNLKEDMLADQPKDITLELVWKNHEGLEGGHVMVSSKKLEFVEDHGSLSEMARAGHWTLDQCLTLFTKPEVLAPEEAWNCPKCQQHREASKQLMLWRMPNVLIIQLKRFSFRSFIWRDKINDVVHFPVNNLDLSKFCIGQKDEMQPAPVYDLYAVINHYGGMIGGHYTAYARLPSNKDSQCSDVCWREFDDRTVTRVDESQVVTRYAYVLFYRRRNPAVERPSRFLGPLGFKSPTNARPTASQASSQESFWTYLDPEEVD